MQRFDMRAFAVLFYFALGALLMWVHSSAAISFIRLDWIAVNAIGWARPHGWCSRCSKRVVHR
jgi:hypothetical protein